MHEGNSTGWDSGVDVQLLIHRNSIDFQHIDKIIGLLEVHTTKISWRGLLTVVWASKYYNKGSKYYKKGEGIKRYEVHTTKISCRETLRKCPFLVVWLSYRRFLVFLSILDSP